MISSRECFCGCDLAIVSANQLAGNLLGWDLTTEFGQWMSILAPLSVSLPERGYGEEPFIVDGRTMWLSLREQVHGGIPQARGDRHITKRWLKFSKKERKKLEKKLRRDGMTTLIQSADFSPAEIRNWVLLGEWPAWMDSGASNASADADPS